LCEGGEKEGGKPDHRAELCHQIRERTKEEEIALSSNSLGCRRKKKGGKKEKREKNDHKDSLGIKIYEPVSFSEKGGKKK